MNDEIAQDKIGKLKIFFGYAAGVGKTYAMLQAAHDAKKNGIDVVAGYIEPHVRPETKALAEGLEALKPLEVEYKGKNLIEFNLDESIKRKPQLILVDELAHTNCSLCRHRKRYQDIEEILRNGIDVYTTVNVQHIESLNDIVESITYIGVRETIPDSFFDSATQVKLVDIEPEELIERLRQGKIYKRNQTKRALNNFFTCENLASLREIALRRTADRVNKILEKDKIYLKNKEFFTEEHILICLGSSPSNKKVIRTAARMAYAFHGELTALFVETPKIKDLGFEDRKSLRMNIKIAEQLGAKVVTVYGEDAPYQIAQYAKASGVSKIVIGKSKRVNLFLKARQNFVDKLISYAENIDVYIIPDKDSSYSYSLKNINIKLPKFSLIDTLKTIGVLSCSTLVGLLFYRLGFTEGNIMAIYVLGVLSISMITSSKLYGVLSSFIGVLTFNFFFTEPRFTFRAYEASYPVTFLVMLIVSILTSTLTIRVKEEAKASAIKSYRTGILLETSNKIQKANDIEEITQEISYQIIKLLNKSVVIYPVVEKKLESPTVYKYSDDVLDEKTYLNEEEKGVVNWVLENKKIAGASTETLQGAKAMYIPVIGHSSVFSVIGILLDNNEEIAPFEKGILIAIISEAALAMERYYLNEKQKEAEMKADRERLRANLLRAISHDLRTPLTCISGNANILMENSLSIGENEKQRLYEDIFDDSIWLINLVENLLSVTRIENGKMELNKQAEFLEEIVIEALKHVSRKKSEHNITVDIKDEMLMAKIDSRLIIQVIINVVDNAIKYTEKESNIVISLRKDNNKAVLEIMDNGKGISDKDKEKLFDMFFTVEGNKGDSRRGLGLGLSLCKSIIDAHSSTLYVKDNKPCGTIFGFSLPLEEVNISEEDNISS